MMEKIMIISNAQVQLQSQHQSLSTRQETLDFQFWKSSDSAAAQPDVQIAIDSLRSEPAQETQQVESLRKNLELEISLLKRLIERLTGKEIKFYTPDSNPQTHSTAEVNIPDETNNSPDFGMSLDYSSSIHESEKMTMSATAVINTSDGRQINAELNISYSRELEIQQNFSLRAGQALKDPLVLNFSGTSLQLGSDSFEFDLDVNGVMDHVPLFQSDTAFLALDRNQDGIINDGSELFGALSGDGFSELSQYDSDGNQWIDENDPVFAQLRLLHVGSDGQQQLISLNEKGVGAIYLNKLATPFELRDSQQQTVQGAIKSSGLYLMESGEAGSLQQIDLAI
jgi:hypothetical protein